MSRVGAIREVWHPQTKQDRDAIFLELQEVLASPHFCNSKRYPALLKYIVENTLAGDSELLKERTLGVEVFDRSPSYDTNADTVVRYTAGEVRKRLSLYYHELDRKPAIQISLPAGSYIPEFVRWQEESKESPDHVGGPATAPVGHSDWAHDLAGVVHEPDSLSPWVPAEVGLRPSALVDIHPRGAQGITGIARHRWWMGIVAIVVVAVAAGFGWRYRGTHPSTPLDDFWGPVLRDQSAAIVCVGGSVFSQTHLSGVATAGKDIEYPFVSMQSASAIAQLSALLEHDGGVTTQLQAAATTPLTEMKEHSVILLGGYNNQWTLRLLQPLRFHFSPGEASASIVDQTSPAAYWSGMHLCPTPARMTTRWWRDSGMRRPTVGLLPWLVWDGMELRQRPSLRRAHTTCSCFVIAWGAVSAIEMSRPS